MPCPIDPEQPSITMPDRILRRRHIECPACLTTHVDQDEFAFRPHQTHLCTVCGLKWQPYTYPTIGMLEEDIEREERFDRIVADIESIEAWWGRMSATACGIVTGILIGSFLLWLFGKVTS